MNAPSRASNATPSASRIVRWIMRLASMSASYAVAGAEAKALRTDAAAASRRSAARTRVATLVGLVGSGALLKCDLAGHRLLRTDADPAPGTGSGGARVLLRNGRHHH